MAKKANPKPASGAKPAAENTVGQIVPKTAPAPAGAAPSPPVKPETLKEKGLLEKADELLEKGEIKVLNDAKNSVAGGIDSLVNLAGGGAAAQVVGAIGKGAVDVLFPTNVIDIIPGGKILSGGKKAAKIAEKLGKEAAEKAKKEALEKAAKEEAEKKAKEATKDGAKKADVSGNKGGHGKKVKRKPGRRCELVPYDELQCDKGQEAHHVVPDWMLRTGKRGAVGQQLPDMPSLAKGPAICLEKGAGEEHNLAHKHTDKVAQRMGRSGKATGTPGTIQLGQAKAISSRAIEKSTGGPAKGGCSRQDIQQQLDEKFKAPDSAKVRAVKDSRKVTDEIRDVLNGGKD